MFAKFDWSPAVTVVTDVPDVFIEVIPGFGWYNPGDGRGHWPGARDVIGAVQDAMPGRAVYYGNEYGNMLIDDDRQPVHMGVLVTEEMLGEHDAAWDQFQREVDADDLDLIVVTHEQVRTALAQLDGTVRSTVRLLTGLSDEDIDALGGIRE